MFPLVGGIWRLTINLCPRRSVLSLPSVQGSSPWTIFISSRSCYYNGLMYPVLIGYPPIVLAFITYLCYYGFMMNRKRTVSTEESDRAKIMSVIEKYFDVDIQTADDAYCVLVDNGCDPGLSISMARDMYPEA